MAVVLAPQRRVTVKTGIGASTIFNRRGSKTEFHTPY
jgi:hypothetical protein